MHCFLRFTPLFLLPLIALAGCQRPPSAAPQLPPPSVTVSHPLSVKLTEYQYYTGQTAAVQTVTIQARVRGFLNKVHFQEGAEVEKGDLLYEIERAPFEASLRRAQAEIVRLRAQLNLARTEETRASQLRERQAVTTEQYEQRVAAREQAEAALEQAEAAKDIAELDLSYTRIDAPIAGRVGRTLVTEGNLVGYNEPTQLTTIVSMDPIYVYFDVPERNVIEYQRRIREEGAISATDRKLPLQIALETEDGYPHEGIVDFRESQVDPGTGTMLIRGVLPNPDRIINPGMFAQVRIPVGEPREQLLVPQVALGSDQRGDFVMTVNGDGEAEYRLVKTGDRLQEYVVIRDGLTPSDLVIVNGIQKARPGAKVAHKLQPLEVPTELAATERTTEAANR